MIVWMKNIPREGGGREGLTFLVDSSDWRLRRGKIHDSGRDEEQRVFTEGLGRYTRINSATSRRERGQYIAIAGGSGVVQRLRTHETSCTS